MAYTRDRQIITQAAWYYANSLGIEKMLHISLPFKYPVVYYLHDGAVEIWENSQSVRYIQDKILSKNKTSLSFLEKILNDFESIQKEYFYPI